jgi:hypothetical protein
MDFIFITPAHTSGFAVISEDDWNLYGSYEAALAAAHEEAAETKTDILDLTAKIPQLN